MRNAPMTWLLLACSLLFFCVHAYGTSGPDLYDEAVSSPARPHTDRFALLFRKR